MNELKARRILVVEDEEMVREIVCWSLEDMGFDVLCASSGDQGLALLGEGGIDLMLTDIRMPGGVDGWTLAEKARGTNPDLPIIYVSGYSHEPPRRLEGSIFLQKPLRSEMLRSALVELGLL